MRTNIGTAVPSVGSESLSYDPKTRYPDDSIEVDVFAFIHTKTCDVGAFSVPVRCADEMFPRINLPEHPDDLADYLTGIFEREYPNANIICYIIEDRRLCFEHCCPFWKPETGEHEGHAPFDISQIDVPLEISIEEPSRVPIQEVRNAG
jgi:hypothetical protein